MLSRNELINELKQRSTKDFNQDFIFNREPWYFSLDDVFATHKVFRDELADVFETGSHNIILVGSGCVGRSLSPRNDLRAFSKKSDLDVVIVSSAVFERVWKELRQAYYSGFYEAKSYYANHIFSGFVSLNKKHRLETTTLRYFTELNDEISKVASTKLRLKNDLNFRLYSNVDHVHAYHNWSLEKLKRKLP